GGDMARQRSAEQGEIGDQIENLVAHELVAETQRTRKDSVFIVENDRVMEVPSTRQTPGPHDLDFSKEAERPGGRDRARVLFGSHRDGERLAADDRMRKVDLIGDGEA